MSLSDVHMRIGEILVALGAVMPEQVQAALATGQGPLGQRLLAGGLITAEQLAQALAEQFQLPFVSLADFAVPGELFERLPASQCYELGVLPYRQEGPLLEVVTPDPSDLNLGDRLERLTGLQVRLLLSSAPAIAAAMQRSAGEAEVLRDVSADFRLALVREEADGERVAELETTGESASPVVRLVNAIIVAALQKRASDIHIETYQRGVVVRYRIDGVLYEATEALDRRHHSAVISRLKVMSELDITERRIPQDGRFKLRYDGRDIDFRVSVLPSAFGEDLVIRILDKTAIAEGVGHLSLESLGMPGDVLGRFRRHIHEPYGMVLITGPTGSGKTTTLYAALNELDAAGEKLITIEDPVEYQLDGIVQVPVNERKQVTFARGLRSILRHDPDKIMIGEIRDSETAQIAVQSALTGHLVFTTVHANNAFDVIGRFSHMGLDVYGFVSALNCVMAQRLVRMICPHCKEPYRPERDLVLASGLAAEDAERPWFRGIGCAHCAGTGHRGRTAVAEFLELSLRIRELILARRPGAELQAAAVEEGMVTLRRAALAKAMAGETTLQEVNRVTFVE
ncbi:MAG TPA: GspE/PulE family protein [bacterium]|nr:GspE/PulE family protein [bacterium]